MNGDTKVTSKVKMEENKIPEETPAVETTVETTVAKTVENIVATTVEATKETIVATTVLTTEETIVATKLETTENTRKRKAEEDEEKRQSRMRRMAERERDFFEMRPDEDAARPYSVPLQGEELEFELQLLDRMREKAIEGVKKHFDEPFIRDYLLTVTKDMTPEEFKAKELEIYAKSLVNPCML